MLVLLQTPAIKKKNIEKPKHICFSAWHRNWSLYFW